MTRAYESAVGWPSRAGKIAALLVFTSILLSPTPEDLPPVAQRMAAVTGLMAVLWVTQALPIAATSLIPLAAFPLLGIQSASDVSRSYIDENMFLFLGGFVIALGLEKWNLHRRIALHIVRVIGGSPKRVVLGFMLATAFLSMWISNTAATLLMLPIGLAMLTSLSDLMNGSDGRHPPTGDSDESRSDDSHPGAARFAVVLMLGIAYAASIGGMTTLVGTPTNIAFQRVWTSHFPHEPQISAGEWMLTFIPLGLLFLLIAWLVLTWRLPALFGTKHVSRSFFTERLKALGKPSGAEVRMLLIFVATALLWVLRNPLQVDGEPILPGWGPGMERLLLWMGTDAELAAGAIHDSTVAIGMALLMFCIPGDRDEAGRMRPLMDWRTAERLPWGILLLIGGGFAVARGFSETGLSPWLGTVLAAQVEGWHVWLLVAAVCLLMTFLTEFTTNVATVNTILPVLAGVAVGVGIDPRLVMIPAALSTSCAFMLPIATPPNAIIFGSGKVSMGQMMRYGVGLNLLGVALITAFAFLVLVPSLGISLDPPGEVTVP